MQMTLVMGKVEEVLHNIVGRFRRICKQKQGSGEVKDRGVYMRDLVEW